VREHGWRLQESGEGDGTSQTGSGESGGLASTGGGDGGGSGGGSSGVDSSGRLGSCSLDNGAVGVGGRVDSSRDRAGGVSSGGGSVDRLGDGARAVSDGQGGGLSDGVSVGTNGELGGRGAVGGVDIDNLGGDGDVGGNGVRGLGTSDERGNGSNSELHFDWLGFGIKILEKRYSRKDVLG